jgi:signal transduction histidine kinase/DNA-binding response OmpR family regulator
MAFLSFCKVLCNPKSIFCKIGLAVILGWLSLTVNAQPILTPAQQQRINQLYQQLQREVVSLPIADVPCAIEVFQQEKKSENVNLEDGFKQVKWLYRNGKTACAVQLLQALRPIAQQLSTNDQHRWLLNLSQLLRVTEQPDSASSILQQLETLHPTPTLQGWIYYEQAALFRNNIQFEKALQLSNKALQIARSVNDRVLETNVLSEIGKTSRDIYRQEPTKYLSFFQEALSVADALQDSSQLTSAYQNLVFVYFFDNSVDIDKALINFEKALAYFPQQSSLYERYKLVHTFVNMVDYFPTESEKVTYLYNHLLKTTRKLKLTDETRRVYMFLANIFHVKKNFPTASAYLDSAMRYDSPDWEKDNFYATRAKVAQAMGNLSLANEYYQKALDEKEQVYLRRNNQSMTQWETQFRTREKELELEQQQRQQWLLWGIVALVSSLLALAIFFFLRNRKQLQLLAQKNAIIEQQSEELRSLDKAKTRFFSNITHEFRTPLTLILSPLETLLKEQPQQQTFHLIYTNAHRLLSLINQLLDLSKIDAGALKPDISKGNLSSFLQLQVESFQSLAENRGIDLRLISQLPPDTEAYYDADKLSKIITNLLSNALKFTPKGGEVNVECRILNDELGGIKEEKSQQQKFIIRHSQFVIQISDTGIGIPPAQLTSIFDRFYQVDSSVRRSFEGSGIGLSLVKELVDVLKGEIRVESEVGKGTTFYLSFPVDAETWGMNPATTTPITLDYSEGESLTPFLPEKIREEFTPPSEDKGLAGTQNAPIVLVVEDNPDLRSYIASLFATTYQVVTATDGQEGLHQAFEHLPDVVITDWMMPEMDGVTMCQRLKNDTRTSHVPVLMLTAKSAIESRLEGFEGGADGYIVKPFHATELQLKVRNWLQRQERLRQLYTQRLAQPQETPPLPETEGDFMERIFGMIDQHLADTSFGVETLSERLQLNRRTLQRKIGSLTHLSPNELIRNHRLRRALPLLKRGDSIADVAFQVGFENPSYFSKCFKEVFGKKPSEVVE